MIVMMMMMMMLLLLLLLLSHEEDRDMVDAPWRRCGQTAADCPQDRPHLEVHDDDGVDSCTVHDFGGARRW
jgi:hypothetical protein